MKEHEIRELVNQLRDIAIKYHAAGQLREQIASAIRSAMLQADNTPVIGIDLASGPDRSVEVRYVAPPGYVMVPKEPTEAMMLHNSGCQHHAWDDPDCAMRQTRRLIWSHMLAAAPQESINALIPLVSRNEQGGDRWIPVSDRMPEDAQWCLVNTEYGYHVQCWSKGQGWLGDECSIPNCDVTHWMPLPAAPQEVKGE